MKNEEPGKGITREVSVNNRHSSPSSWPDGRATPDEGKQYIRKKAVANRSTLDGTEYTQEIGHKRYKMEPAKKPLASSLLKIWGKKPLKRCLYRHQDTPKDILFIEEHLKHDIVTIQEHSEESLHSKSPEHWGKKTR